MHSKGKSVCVFPLIKISSLRGAFVCLENDHMYSTDNEGPKHCVDYSTDNEGPKHCVDYSTDNKGPKNCVDFSPLQRYTASCIVCHVCSQPFWKPRISVSIACAFSRICACVALRALHFSAFI